MTRFAFRAIFLAIKGVACLIGGLLFGALPLLAIAACKILKGGTIAAWRVATWMLRSA